MVQTRTDAGARGRGGAARHQAKGVEGRAHNTLDAAKGRFPRHLALYDKRRYRSGDIEAERTGLPGDVGHGRADRHAIGQGPPFPGYGRPPHAQARQDTTHADGAPDPCVRMLMQARGHLGDRVGWATDRCMAGTDERDRSSDEDRDENGTAE